METIIMFIENDDGKIIEKEVEARLVSTYKSIGWEIKKEEKPVVKEESSFKSSNNSKRFGK